MERLQRVLHFNRRQILNKDKVVGVGIGPKLVRGENTGENSIKVYVTEKLKKDEITAKNLIPTKINGVKTDVVEVGEIKALPATDKVRPAYPGVSIGHYAITAGTLGAIVKSRKSGEYLILSNNHVLANVSNGRDGRANKGDIILQPGPADGGNKDTDIIAYLDTFVPLISEVETPQCNIASAAAVLGNALIRKVRPNYKMILKRATAGFNKVDAAVAKPINKKVIKSDIPEIGKIQGAAEANLRDKIKKLGRTSGLTTGVVDGLDVTIEVAMADGISSVFENQIVSDLKSLPGDSGSLVLNSNNEAVGLLFAGSSSRTVINPINSVLEELDIELV